MKLGQRLTELREKKGLTQDQMAERLGIKRPRYNSWENNIAKPDIEFIDKLAELHNVSVDFLLGREPSEIPEWATSKDKRDFKTMLEEDGDVMFDGVPISDEDKEKIKRVMEAMFWDAKKENKKHTVVKRKRTSLWTISFRDSSNVSRQTTHTLLQIDLT